MRELVVTVRSPTGLHARPAAILARGARRFRSEIRAAHGGRQIDAKRALSLLALGVRSGGRIHIHVEGPDEEQAADALLRLTEGDWEAESGVEAAPSPLLQSERHPGTPGRILRGHPLAPGLAVGTVFRFGASPAPAAAMSSAALEQQRLGAALEATRDELAAMQARVRGRAGEDGAAIFEVHRSLLEDATLLSRARAAIDAGADAAGAWRAALEPERATLERLEDPRLSSRAADVGGVAELVERRLRGTAVERVPQAPAIVAAEELLPWDLARMDSMLGLCTLRGGPGSHTALLARALGIPAVAGVAELPRDGALAILDGEAGTLELDPDPEAVLRAGERQRERVERRAVEAAASRDPARTREGRSIEVLANLGGPAGVHAALACGASGVGLLRTEFLFAGRDEPPGEDEQFAAYRDLVIALQGRTLTVRTLDAGSDKPLRYLGAAREDNPALGLRGIRLALAHPELLATQLRAIARASAHGPVRVMFPMVTTLEEWRSAREWLERACRERGVCRLASGPMIEVPAAALLAERFAAEADFLSIGTNDLTQYALAMDRMHHGLATAADGLHPAVLRLIRGTVEAAHAAGLRSCVCGELASDLDALPLLLGLGVDEVSVNPVAVPAVKARIRRLALSSAAALAARALACGTAAEVRELAAGRTAAVSTPAPSRFSRYRSVEAPPPERALCWNLYGPGLESLGRDGRPESVPVPDPAPDQLLVRVDAVGLCYSDVKILMQGSRHPKLQGRDLASRPTRLGHEVALTVVRVGGALRERFRPGQRLALQPDIHQAGASAAYGYAIHGGLTQYHLLGPEVLSGDAGCYVIEVEADLGYAAIALSEPWACVEAAYTQRRRLHPRAGGRLWIAGRPDDLAPYRFSRALEAGLVVATGVPDTLARWLRDACASAGTRLIERDAPAPADLARLRVEATEGAGFDDIVLLAPRSAEQVAAAAGLVAAGGTLNLVGRDPLEARVPLDVGRIHYDRVAYLGNPGPDIAASYGEERNRCRPRRDGCLVVVGAGGPMGQMHVQRALELAEGSRTIVASEMSAPRLAALAARFEALAARHGKRLVYCGAAVGESLAEVVGRETGGRADDVVVCVPDAGSIAAAARAMKPDGMLVFFAGVPRETFVPLDLSAVYLGGAQYTGTSGSTLSDQREVLERALEGGLCLGRSVAAIGGIEAAREGLEAVRDGRFPGKVVVFPQIRGLPLTPLADLRRSLPEVADALEPGGVWSSAAEAALVESLWDR